MRIIIHVDMNAYFASVEAKANPALKDKPIVVVADQNRRSVILTSSYEARKYGIKTGMLLYEAKQACLSLVVVEGDSSKYEDTTNRIVEIFQRFTDRVELASIDEAYLDITGTVDRLKKDGFVIAREIQNKVTQELDLPCSIGVAPNKLLAKLASDKKKPNGITEIKPDEVAKVLAETKVEELCGVGPRLQPILNEMGIKTAKDLGDTPVSTLYGRFGFLGYWLKRMGQGKDDSPVRRPDEGDPPKSVGHSHTLPKNTTDRTIAEAFLLLLSEKVAFRMRKAGYSGKVVSLILRFSDFKTISRQETLGEPTQEGSVIYKAALRLLDQYWMNRQPVRLFGVSVAGLSSAGGNGFLFDDLKRRVELTKAVDLLNRKYGAFTVKPVAVLNAEKYGVLPIPLPPRPMAVR